MRDVTPSGLEQFDLIDFCFGEQAGQYVAVFMDDHAKPEELPVTNPFENSSQQRTAEKAQRDQYDHPDQESDKSSVVHMRFN